MARHEKGHTLVELLTVICIFSIVMTLISVSFNRIVASSSQIVKSAETDIGGLIGLELLRSELGLAGFGLPWSLGGARYSGEAKSHLVDGNKQTDAANFNDSSDNGPPRAFIMQNDKGLNGSDYLVLKGTALGVTSSASRGWSYLNYSSTGPVIKQSKSALELVPGHGDRVIALRSGARGGAAVRELVTNGSSFSFSFDDPIPEAFQPISRQDSYLVYGISAPPDPKDPDDIITFPFNRADYYLGPATPDNLSLNCAPGTGFLYRGVVSQKGNFKPFPILDCVADLQVIFLLNTSDDGTLVPHNDISGYTVEELRELVKEVRVYVLAQLGKKDPGYSYPVGNPESAIVVGDPVNGRVWKQSDLVAKFGSDWLHYRWKLYTIAVQPKNL